MKLLCVLVVYNLICITVSQETIVGKIIHSSYRMGTERESKEISNLKIRLNYGQYTTFSNKDGTFQLQNHNILPGKYLLQVVSKSFLYESAFIEVIQTPRQQAKVLISRVHPLNRKRSSIAESQDQRQRTMANNDLLVLHQIEKIQYFQLEEELTLASIYKNQYFFMIAMTVAMLFLVKKMPMEEIQNAERPPVENR